MREIDTSLWVDEQPLRFFGMQIGARMTAVKLPSGAVWLHSPIAATPARIEAVKALGPVGSIVAPNRFHHLHVGDWKDAFPDATLYGAPGLAEKRTDLTFDVVLDDDAEVPAFEGALQHVCLRGMSLLNEVLFFHPATQTLIATDLGFNVQEPAMTKAMLWASGCTHTLSPTFLEQMAIRDKAAFAESLTRALDWDFERVVIAHGEIVESDAKPLIRRGYRFLGALGA